MKKITLVLMAIFLSLTFCPTQSNGANTRETTPTSLVARYPEASPEAKVLLKRLDEINNLDKSNLKSSEKKELRKEVRSIKKQLQEMGGYVYLSVGAIIIIILLLIILL